MVSLVLIYFIPLVFSLGSIFFVKWLKNYYYLSFLLSFLLSFVSVYLFYAYFDYPQELFEISHLWLAEWGVFYEFKLTQSKAFTLFVCFLVFSGCKLLWFYEPRLKTHAVLALSFYEALLTLIVLSENLLVFIFAAGSMFLPKLFLISDSQAKSLNNLGVRYFSILFSSLLLLMVSFLIMNRYSSTGSVGVLAGYEIFKYVACLFMILGLTLFLPIFPFQGGYFPVGNFRSVSSITPFLFSLVIFFYGFTTFAAPVFRTELIELRHILFFWGSMSALFSIYFLAVNYDWGKRIFGYLLLVSSISLVGLSSMTVDGFIGVGLVVLASLLSIHLAGVLLIYNQGRSIMFDWSDFSKKVSHSALYFFVSGSCVFFPVSFGFIGVVLILGGIFEAMGPVYLLVFGVILFLAFLTLYKNVKISKNEVHESGALANGFSEKLLFLHVAPFLFLLVGVLFLPDLVLRSFLLDFEKIFLMGVK